MREGWSTLCSSKVSLVAVVLEKATSTVIVPEDWVKLLTRRSSVSLLPEVTECFSVSGDRDYVLHVVVKDMDSYNDFLNAQILKHSAVRSASSTFVLRRVKYSTELHL